MGWTGGTWIWISGNSNCGSASLKDFGNASQQDSRNAWGAECLQEDFLRKDWLKYKSNQATYKSDVFFKVTGRTFLRWRHLSKEKNVLSPYLTVSSQLFFLVLCRESETFFLSGSTFLIRWWLVKVDGSGFFAASASWSWGHLLSSKIEFE